MSKQNVVKAYFNGLEKGSYEDIIALFAAKALVHSPLYGQIEAVRFYKELFADTQNSKITLMNTFVSTDNPDTAAAHFNYAWAMKDGTAVQFECIDVFNFVPNTDKIIALTIIYDTYLVRGDFARVHSNTKS